MRNFFQTTTIDEYGVLKGKTHILFNYCNYSNLSADQKELFKNEKGLKNFEILFISL